MTFPLDIAGRTFATAPELAQAVLRDARAGGGTVVSGERPSIWLAGAVRSGALSEALARGLIGALVQQGEPAGLVEAARLAANLDLGDVGPLLGAALDALDVGVLLKPVPGEGQSSVEDVVLRSWAALASSDDPEQLRRLLTGLRGAGLRSLELRAVLSHADASVIEELLPDILAEELLPDEGRVLVVALDREPSVAAAIAAVLAALPPVRREAVWRRMVASRPALEHDEAMRMAWAVDRPT